MVIVQAVSDTHFYAVQPYKTKASEDYTADKNSANTVTEWQRECSHSNKYNNVCNTTPAKYAYVGDKAYVKAMIRFNRATICDGDGSKSNPFVISVK